MKKSILFAGLTLCIMGVFTAHVEAYEVVDTTAVRVTDEVSLYSITYEFGFLNAELFMAMVPTSPLTKELKPKVSYALETDTGEAFAGNSVGVVLAEDAEIRNGYYYVPEGERAQFTLLVLLEHGAGGAPEAPLALQLQKLFGAAIKDGEARLFDLYEDELGEYRTEGI